jgi:hypothetical protein
MRSKSLKIKALLIVMCISLHSVQAIAQGLTGMKRLKLHAGVEGIYTYDDNIFLGAGKTFANGTSEPRTPDSIFIISPYFDLTKNRLRGEFFGFNLNYRFKDINYSDVITENRHENDARLGLIFADKGEHLQLTLRGRYLDTVDQSTSEFFSNFGVRAKRNDLSWNGELAWAISKRLKAAATGGFRYNEYKNTGFMQETFEQVDIGGNIFYDISPLTSFGFKYNYRPIKYTAAATFNRDSHLHSISAIVRWQPSAIISGDFGVGYDNKSFEGPGLGSQDTFNYHTHLKYHLNSRTQFHFNGKRSVEESTFSVIDSYIRTFVALAWNQKWSHKIKSSVTGQYMNRNYNTAVADVIDDGGKLKNRNDDEFSAEVRVDYQLSRWYKAGLSYVYTQNESNFNVFDYKSNVLTLSLSAGF